MSQSKKRVVVLADYIAKAMYEIIRISENHPEIDDLIVEGYPFKESLDEVATSVIDWRDSMRAHKR